MKYEALVLRDSNNGEDDHSLRVSFEEWLTFGKDSLDNGFYAIAVKVKFLSLVTETSLYEYLN